jgi:hypothetical protein
LSFNDLIELDKRRCCFGCLFDIGKARNRRKGMKLRQELPKHHLVKFGLIARAFTQKREKQASQAIAE